MCYTSMLTVQKKHMWSENKILKNLISEIINQECSLNF